MGRSRIAVFERMPLFREGIIHVLNGDDGMHVVAEGSSVADVLNLSKPIDVIVIDDDLLQASSAPDALSSLCTKARVVLTTFPVTEEHVRAAFAAGVRGYVLKAGGRHELLAAVHAACNDDCYISPSLAADVMRRRSAPGSNDAVSVNAKVQLSHREGQIFDLLAAGFRNKEIGRRLNLSEKSVKRYVTCIFEKLKVRNRVEAAILSTKGVGTDRTAPRPDAHMRASDGVVLTASPPLGTDRIQEEPFRCIDGVYPARVNETAAEIHNVRCFTRIFACSASTIQQGRGDLPLGTHMIL